MVLNVQFQWLICQNVWVSVWPYISFKTHLVNKTCSAGFYHLRNNSCIKKFLSPDLIKSFFHSFITSPTEAHVLSNFRIPILFKSQLQNFLPKKVPTIFCIPKKFPHCFCISKFYYNLSSGKQLKNTLASFIDPKKNSFGKNFSSKKSFGSSVPNVFFLNG